MKIICYSKKTYRIIQEHLFKKGYVWSTTGPGIWYPKYAKWNDGEVIQFTESYLYTTGNLRKDYDMIDYKYIKKFINTDFNIKRDIVNIFDNEINGIF